MLSRGRVLSGKVDSQPTGNFPRAYGLGNAPRDKLPSCTSCLVENTECAKCLGLTILNLSNSLPSDGENQMRLSQRAEFRLERLTANRPRVYRVFGKFMVFMGSTRDF